MNIGEFIGAFIAFMLGAICIAAVLGLLIAFPVMWLWNIALVPLGVGAIGYWQAWGLYLLCAILFKNTSVNSN